jgi:adenylate cyclase
MQVNQPLARRTQWLLTGSIVVANVIGAASVSVLAGWVLPGVGALHRGTVLPNLLAVPAYVLVAAAVGVAWGTRRVRRCLDWFDSDRVPEPAEQRATLRVPLTLLRIQGELWLGGLVAFSVFEAAIGPVDVVRLDLTIALGGAVTCAAAYLLSELFLRPVNAVALSVRPPDEAVYVPGLAARSLLAWALGSAVPAIGLIIEGTLVITGRGEDLRQVGASVLVLSGVLLVVGLLFTVLAIRATVDPVLAVRRAMAGVERGELDVEVPIFDGTELGLLQAGFNRMVAGLRERERLRDLFGRHVGQDVAQAALEEGASLGGEEREVSVLFVDIVGSTGLALRLSPSQVVEQLNDFFSVVVEVVTEEGGSINKFEGDAALAVFGAPSILADHAGRCLRAGRRMARRLQEEVAELDAAVGMASGRVVAGNVGAEDRFEYTVIGDPVNEAARLTEAAKAEPGRVLASWAAVSAAGQDERACWAPGEELVLRGRDRPTRLGRPRA